MQESLSPSTELVSFDLWLTLIKSDGQTFKLLRNGMLRLELAPSMDDEQFNAVVRTADKQADELAETRGDDVLFGERVALIARELGIEPPDDATIDALYAAQAGLLAEHPPVLIDPETPGYLESLKNDGRKLAVVSNTGFIHGDQMRGVLNGLGIGRLFDHTVFSNEVGYAKPDARIYEELIRQSSVPAERITHIGDNERADIRGARAVGMRAIHLDGTRTLRDAIGEIQ